MFLNKIKKYIQATAFNPTWPSMALNPFYLVRKELFKEISLCAQYITGDVLDVGCGSKPYVALFTNSTSYVGLEYESPILKEKKVDVDFTYDGKKFPFEDSRYDSVVSFQVLEHVFEPEQFILEMKRVLKNNGTLLITVPFLWDEHEQPFDYARYTSFGLKYLFEKNNFKVVYQKKTLANCSALVQLLIVFLYKRVPKNKYMFYFACFFVFFPLNIIGSIVNLTKNSEDFYMDNIIVLENRK
jgi:SAM-dependent methyltransferase